MAVVAGVEGESKGERIVCVRRSSAWIVEVREEVNWGREGLGIEVRAWMGDETREKKESASERVRQLRRLVVREKPRTHLLLHALQQSLPLLLSPFLVPIPFFLLKQNTTPDRLQEPQIPKCLHGALSFAGLPPGQSDHAAHERAIELPTVRGDVGGGGRAERLNGGGEGVQCE